MADSTNETTSPAPEQAPKSFTQRMLDGIERVGNKVPHPAMIFVYLILFVILLSQILYMFDISVTYDVAEQPPTEVDDEYVGGSVVPEPDIPPEDYADGEVDITQETTAIESLLTVEGLRFIFTSFVTNFASFSVVAVVLVAMIGVGVAEEAGLMGALIRKLVKVSPRRALTFIIILIGGLSSVATDAGYLILIPLGAAAFLSVGKHPLAGLAAAYAGVSAAFSVNILIAPLDGLLTEVTNESVQLVDPDATIGITANLWFAIISTIAMALVMTVVTTRVIEPRLGAYLPEPRDDHREPAALTAGVADDGSDDIDTVAEARGLRFASFGLLAAIAVVVLATAPSGAPLRNPETGSIIEDAPFMDSLIFIITGIFLVLGICYGIGAKTLTGSVAIINAIIKTFASLSGLIFLLLLISQFIAFFNYSNMPTVAAVEMADLLERVDIGAIWLLIGFILVIAILDIIIPGSLPKWAIFAPIFIPLFIRLDVAPQTVLAAYRVGDSPMNVITPLMVYLPFIVIVAQRYRRSAGIGTIISLMIPYTLIVLITWLLFFIAWVVLGIPLGPGYPVDTG
jgi:aminobenzoyl-glutamate transport protein